MQVTHAFVLELLRDQSHHLTQQLSDRELKHEKIFSEPHLDLMIAPQPPDQLSPSSHMLLL